MVLRIRDVMTPDPISVHPKETIHRCVSLMQQHHIRHLPVIDHAHQVVGVLSQRDLLARGLLGPRNERREGHEDDDAKVSDAMTKVYHVVKADDPAVKAASMMLNNGYSCLPVIDHGRLVGIITSVDFVRLVRDRADLFDDGAADGQPGWVD